MVTPTVFEISFETHPMFEFKAGQFVNIVIPGAAASGKDLKRAYSIASPPGKTPVCLCIKVVDHGPGTSYLRNLNPGDRLRLFAPYGHFVYKTQPNRIACFVSTGTGISPFRSMLESAELKVGPPNKIWLLYGAREESEILYEKELSEIPNMSWVSAISRPSPAWKGFKGRVTDYLRANEKYFDWSSTDFYLCGNGAMIKEVKAFLIGKGVAKEAIFQEIYYTPKST